MIPALKNHTTGKVHYRTSWGEPYCGRQINGPTIPFEIAQPEELTCLICAEAGSMTWHRWHLLGRAEQLEANGDVIGAIEARDQAEQLAWSHKPPRDRHMRGVEWI
jgi:hypothetical protein